MLGCVTLSARARGLKQKHAIRTDLPGMLGRPARFQPLTGFKGGGPLRALLEGFRTLGHFLPCTSVVYSGQHKAACATAVAVQPEHSIFVLLPQVLLIAALFSRYTAASHSSTLLNELTVRLFLVTPHGGVAFLHSTTSCHPNRKGRWNPSPQSRLTGSPPTLIFSACCIIAS